MEGLSGCDVNLKCFGFFADENTGTVDPLSCFILGHESMHVIDSDVIILFSGETKSTQHLKLHWVLPCCLLACLDFTQSLIHSSSRSFPHSFTHYTFAHSHVCSFVHLLFHDIDSLPHECIHSFTFSPTHSLTHSLHILPRSLCGPGCPACTCARPHASAVNTVSRAYQISVRVRALTTCAHREYMEPISWPLPT